MKQIDYLVEAIDKLIRYHASVGVGSRILILVASQNEELIHKALGETAHAVLRGSGWDNQELSQTELKLRSTLLQKDLFYSKRINITVKVKQWPESVGTHLSLDVSNYDRVLYDQDMCESYIRYLEKG